MADSEQQDGNGRSTTSGFSHQRQAGAQVSELSHQEPGWRLTEVGETIPFSTAFLDFPQIQTPTSKRLSKVR